MRYPPELWNEIVFDLLDGSTKAKVAKEYGAQKRTIDSAIARFKATGQFYAKGGPPKGTGGRPRITTRAEDKKVKKLICKHRHQTEERTASTLKSSWKTTRPVSRRTVGRRIKLWMWTPNWMLKPRTGSKPIV